MSSDSKLQEHIATLMGKRGCGCTTQAHTNSRDKKRSKQLAQAQPKQSRSGASTATAAPEKATKPKATQQPQTQPAEEGGILYTQLAESVRSKVLPLPVNAGAKGKAEEEEENPAATITKFVTGALMATIGVSEKEATQLARAKLDNQWLLLEQGRPVTNQVRMKRQQRAHMRSRSGRATAKTKRENGLLIPSGKTAAGMEHEKLGFLRQLWLAYAEDLLEGCTTPEMAAVRLVRADFHGATIRVVQTKTPPLLGLEGTVVQETAAVFKVVTKANVCKTVPKAGSIFEVQTSRFKVVLFGMNICQKPSERSKKKNKVKYTIEIV